MTFILQFFFLHDGFPHTGGMPPWARPLAALPLLAALAGVATAVNGCSGTLDAAVAAACRSDGLSDSACCSSAGSCARDYIYHAGESKCDGDTDTMIATCCLQSVNPATTTPEPVNPATTTPGSAGSDDECQVGTIRWANASDHGSIWPNVSNGSATCPPCGPGRRVSVRLFLLHACAHRGRIACAHNERSATLIGGPPQILVVEHVKAWLHCRDKLLALLGGEVHWTLLRGTRVPWMCFGQVLPRRGSTPPTAPRAWIWGTHRVLELLELFDLAVREYGPRGGVLHLRKGLHCARPRAGVQRKQHVHRRCLADVHRCPRRRARFEPAPALARVASVCALDALKCALTLASTHPRSY